MLRVASQRRRNAEMGKINSYSGSGTVVSRISLAEVGIFSRLELQLIGQTSLEPLDSRSRMHPRRYRHLTRDSAVCGESSL